MAESSAVLQDEALIGAVRNYPEIYDPRCMAYKNSLKKAAAWAAVSSSVSQPAEECKHRWKTLRDKFVREKKKVTVRKSGDGATVVQVWPLMGILMFLSDTISHRSSVGNMTVSSQNPETDPDSSVNLERAASPLLNLLANGGMSEEETSVTEAVIQENRQQEIQEQSETSQPTVINPPVVAQCVVPCAPGKRRKKMDPTEKYLLEIIKSSSEQIKASKSAEVPISDEDDHFWLQIKPSLKALPDQKKSMVKIKIMELIHTIQYE